MGDVGKSAVRWLGVGLMLGLLAATAIPANAQSVGRNVNIGRKPKQETHARRETNASREARIQRTITDTYSHRYEVIGGGGYMRFRSGEYTKKNNEITWATAVNYYLNPKLAIVGDARGMFGNARVITPNTYGVYNPQINEYTFMGGVSYRFYRQEKLALSAQALGGEGWGIFSGGAKGYPGSYIGIWNDGFRPAFSLGVSADYNLYPNLAFRLTPTYVGTTFVGPTGSSVQNNIGFNMGVVYRFGRQ
jgi:hypothetical protein